MAALTLHQLDVFRCVARHLNFTRAAEDLHLSQPAVTRQVQLLENTLGERLFVVRGRRILLTDAGRDVLEYAARIGTMLDELEQVVAARRGLLLGTLRLIATSTAGEYLLPPLVAGFQHAHPGIHVQLRVANREQVLRALTVGEADLALMGRPPDGRGWFSRPILPNELVAIAPPDDRGEAGPALKAAELAARRLFLREPGSGTRLAVEEFLRTAGVPIDAGLELGSDSAIKQAVMAGLGVSVLSRQAVELELAVGRLAILPVEGLPLRRQWFIVHPSEASAPPAVRAFTLFLGQRLKGFSQGRSGA